MRHEKNTKSPEILNFSTNYFDIGTGLLKNDVGAEVHLRKQSADVLSVLAAHAGTLVNKKTLIDAVWPDVVTTDDSLVQCIADIRRVLGRDAVVTISKKGYRLVPTAATPELQSISNATEINAEKANAKNFLAILVGSVLLFFGLLWLGVDQLNSGSRNGFIKPPAISHQKTLAVLPFANLSNDSVVSYFSSGLGEDLTTDLSKVPGLTVISYASSFDYPNAESGFKKIAKQLGVRYIVRGTVRPDAQRLRINVSLIDSLDGFNVWTERYDRNKSDPFDIQEEVIRQIVNALSLKLNLKNTLSTEVNPDAHYMLLRGLEPLRLMSASGNQEARVYFNRALAFDPNYARAHSNIALTYGRDSLHTHLNTNSRESIDMGLTAAVTAIQLNPESPEAYQALGLLNLAKRDYDSALSAARHAVKLDANYADGYSLLAEVALYGGDLHEALSSIRRAKLLHPHHPTLLHWVEGHILFQMGRHEEAQSYLSKAFELSPKFQPGLVTLAANYSKIGKFAEANSLLAYSKKNSPNFNHLEIISKIPYRTAIRKQKLIDSLQKAAQSL